MTDYMALILDLELRLIPLEETSTLKYSYEIPSTIASRLSFFFKRQGGSQACASKYTKSNRTVMNVPNYYFVAIEYFQSLCPEVHCIRGT